MKLTKQQIALIEQVRAKGCLVMVFPRLKRMSINGFPRVPYSEGLAKLKILAEKENANGRLAA